MTLWLRRFSIGALLLCACTRPAEPVLQRGDEPIQTDDLEYTARQSQRDRFPDPEYAFTLVARFENRSPAPIYLARCASNSPHPIYWLERIAQEDALDTSYNRAWACVGHDQPIVVEPRQVRMDTLHLSGPNMVDGHTGVPHGSPTGLHRLYYEAASCPGMVECRLPADAVGSNVFRVHARSHARP